MVRGLSLFVHYYYIRSDIGPELALTKWHPRLSLLPTGITGSRRNGIMRIALWSLTAGLLGLGIVVVIGCGSKGDPSPEPDQIVQSEPDPKTIAVVEPVYETDVSKHSIPASPVVGRLGGERVTGEVSIESGELVVRKAAGTPGEDWRVAIKLPPEALLGEPCRLVIPPEKTPGASIFIEFPKPLQFVKFGPVSGSDPTAPPKRIGWEPMKVMIWEGGCALTIELGKRAGNKIPGKFYLALPEIETQTEPQLRNFLGGTFEAAYLRLPTDPPGVEDVPLINGTVKVIGAEPDATLTVGYAANPSPELFPLGAVEAPLDQTVPVHSTYDKPRVSSLVAGGGKNMPSRFEHSRLLPGRYLVFAALKQGPVVWKWVDVGPQSTSTVDLSIDVKQTGGLEVNAPLEALDKVQLVPADDPLRPPLTDLLFGGLAMQLQIEQPIIARKALFKNLSPGRYEVRANKQIRHIEIVAGKTMELDFDKKVLPSVPNPAPAPTPKG